MRPSLLRPPVCLPVLLMLLATCMSASAQTGPRGSLQRPLASPIIVDHRSVAQFDSIPPQYADAARRLRMLFMDRSVGGNISDGLGCLSAPHATAPSQCKRADHGGTPSFSSDPSEVRWNGVWDRSNWRYEYWPPNCNPWYGSVQCFSEFIEPRIDSFDVVSFQFSYLEVNSGSNIAHPVDGFFGTRSDRGTASAYAALGARHPSKALIWWTTSLARGIGTVEARDFNDAMRAYVRTRNLVLFDVADILSHDPSGAPCYDNRDGQPYAFGNNSENHPDDGLDLPAICPHYTTETEGGHLGSVSAGKIRVAKAFWVLMAQLAGWEPGADTTRPFAAVPLTEMGSLTYKGQDGGLYGGSTNTAPPAHRDAGRALAHAVIPLAADGTPDPVNGRIGLLSVGMSNTSQEYTVFESLADTFALRNRAVVTVNGAQGGQTASIIRNPSVDFWRIIAEDRLPRRNLTPAQVQVIWLKEANAGPTQPFPMHADMLRDDLRAIVRLLPEKFPNLRLVYLSSRTYGGWATTQLNPEPYAYESGFAVRAVIRAQIDGDTALAYALPGRRAAWMAWGPYLWASGETPRLDGLTWTRADVAADGTHPSDAGRMKAARLLLEFFSTDETASPWFLASGTTGLTEAPRLDRFSLSIAPNPASGSTLISWRGDPALGARIEIYTVLGRRVAAFEDAGIGHRVVDLSPLQPGMYLVRMLSAGTSRLAPLIILRR